MINSISNFVILTKKFSYTKFLRSNFLWEFTQANNNIFVFVNNKTSTTSTQIIFQFLNLFFLVAIILFIGFLFIKIANKAKMTNAGKGNLEIIESMGISFQNYIQLVRVCDKYILIAVNKDKITLLTELENPEIKEKTFESINLKNNFEKYLSENIKKLSEITKKQNINQEKENQTNK